MGGPPSPEEPRRDAETRHSKKPKREHRGRPDSSWSDRHDHGQLHDRRALPPTHSRSRSQARPIDPNADLYENPPPPRRRSSTSARSDTAWSWTRNDQRAEEQLAPRDSSEDASPVRYEANGLRRTNTGLTDRSEKHMMSGALPYRPISPSGENLPVDQAPSRSERRDSAHSEENLFGRGGPPQGLWRDV